MNRFISAGVMGLSLACLLRASTWGPTLVLYCFRYEGLTSFTVVQGRDREPLICHDPLICRDPESMQYMHECSI